ncbi:MULTISPECIES: glycosyltransferase family protein [Catenuloplanes]|uniref:Uncharacterized protein n=1 Tax=Catenuloplanes niger TaxID=587534 RepID=A0AAE4D008_9ACTN|nr:hypothetical protein [Catenuloplanes niger]MDR7327449.1 hypothetical protein [Catenuloplanes niger]
MDDDEVPGADRMIERVSGRGRRRKWDGASFGPRELAAAGSALLILVVLIKIYGVAHFSLTTTTGLLAAPPVQVALGTVTIYAYHVLPALALGTCWLAVRYRRDIAWGVWPVIVIVAIVATLASPFQYLLVELGVVAVAALLELGLWRLIRHRTSPTLNGLRGMMFVYLAAAVLAYQFLASLDAPWVSAQAFRVDSAAVVRTQHMTWDQNEFDVLSDRVFIGYPIAEEAGWLTVLHADSRYLMRFPSSSVRDRLTCHYEKDQLQGDRPLLSVLQGRPYDSPNIDCELVRTYLYGRP